MPNLFDGYCYDSLSDAANAEISRPAAADLNGGSVPVSFAALSDSSGTLTFNASDNTSFSLLRVYPSCSQVGYQHNLTGLSLVDVEYSSWLVVGVWAVVWGFKVLWKKAL
ncbi:hypothetical protein [Methylobacter sp.]|uniref:hypothetical protein n=1 Tax=Methylobacter sp. TaxID=2051955 RepID=UPI003DA30F8A